jgi:hypothetical protein
MHKCHLLLYEFHFHKCTRNLRAALAHTRRLWVGGLLDLRMPGLLRHRTLRQEKSHDVLCSRLFGLLDWHYYRSWTV